MTILIKGGWTFKVTAASVLLAVLCSCSQQGQQADAPEVSAQAPTTPALSTPSSSSNVAAADGIPTAPAPSQIAQPQGHTVGDQWNYEQQSDPMGRGTTYFAGVLSTNTVTFGFPYGGAQHATLVLRSHPRYGKNLILKIERGQFLCPSYDGCQVLVRFDDANAVRYRAVGPADNSTETLFITAYDSFLRHLEKSKRVRISANVYQQGAPMFEFDITGFDTKKYVQGTSK